MTLAAPRLLALLLLAPVAFGAVAWLWRRRAKAESAWIASTLRERLRSGGAPRAASVAAALTAIAVAGAALALARPRWGESTERVERAGVDVVFVLDTSLSMGAQDVSPSRFWLAELMIRRLVEALPGDRVALVETEGVSVVASPLTLDAAVVDLLLDAAEPGSLPLPGTTLASGLERAAALFPPGGGRHRAIVLISDGEDFGSDWGPIQRKLAEDGVVLNAIGVGTAHGAPVPVPGAPGEVKRDREGRAVISRLDAATLRRLSDATGGVYFEAAASSADPTPIVRRIEQLEKRSLESSLSTSEAERFQWPIGVACAALALSLGLTGFRLRVEEAKR